MNSAELHSAYVWDCDSCGQENFCRAIESAIDEAALQAADEDRIDAHLETADYTIEGDPGDETCSAPMLIQRVCLTPKTVTCSSCGREYKPELPALDDDEDYHGPLDSPD